MANRRWVYRMSYLHSFYHTGPYAYLMSKVYEKLGLTKEDVQPLKDVLYAKERWTGTPYESNINDRLRKIPVFDKLGCFSTFKAQRPGLWDDPLLRQNVLARKWNRQMLYSGDIPVNWSGFGFDSLQQMEAWFDDEEELRILKKFGFNLNAKKIDSRHVIQGLKQVWVVQPKVDIHVRH